METNIVIFENNPECMIFENNPECMEVFLKPKGKTVKTNIVIFENNPECLEVFRVPETAVSAHVLNAIVGLFFNYDDVTVEDWSNFDVVNVAVSEEMRASNGVEKLDFPFQPLPGETVYHVFVAT